MKTKLRVQASVDVFHLSPHKFDNFQQQYGFHGNTQIGFHFGEEEAALNRADGLYAEGKIEDGQTLYIYDVTLNINNPLRLSENRVGSWSPHQLLMTIFREQPPGITPEMVDDYERDIVLLPNGENMLEDFTMGPPEDDIQMFIEWFNTLGYDSIVYENEFEHGGDSYIVFDPSQVTVNSVTEFQYEPNDVEQ